RMQWALDALDGVAGQTVLELGPLEAGHTYMLEQADAKAITAVEANTRAHLKCLVIKELVGLSRTRCLCGDFVEYLRAAPRVALLCAIGVLYNMSITVALTDLIAPVAARVFIWTRYCGAAIIQANPQLATKSSPPVAQVQGGFAHKLFRHE